MEPWLVLRQACSANSNAGHAQLMFEGGAELWTATASWLALPSCSLGGTPVGPHNVVQGSVCSLDCYQTSYAPQQAAQTAMQAVLHLDQHTAGSPASTLLHSKRTGSLGWQSTACIRCAGLAYLGMNTAAQPTVYASSTMLLRGDRT